MKMLVPLNIQFFAGTQIGLKRFHAAILTKEEENGTTTYGIIKRISQAITANITPNFSITTLYADDQAVEVDEALGDIDIEIGVKDLSTEDYAFLLGKTINEDGVIEDSVNDVAPYIAIGFEIPLSGGGRRLYWYYKGKFQPPAASHQTKQGSVAYQTPTITGKFMAREDGKWRARLDSTHSTAKPEVLQNWFNAVYVQSRLLPAPTNVAGTPDANSVSLTWDTVTGATGYVVYRDGVSIGSPTANSYNDTGLTAETEYEYQVAAKKDAAEGTKSTTITVTTTA
ncbi:phage tail protein [Lysinibacillus boronitolerans]|nr:phage tail protein [Lysinibacillus boronitolerans]